MKTTLWRFGLRLSIPVLAGTVLAAFGMIGGAKAADTDNVTLQTTVLVDPHAITCNFNGGTPSSNTTGFSFDISWVDSNVGIYLLADRSHGNPAATPDSQTGHTAGDILVIDTDTHTVIPLLPPLDDPMAGVRCDANADFGGSTAAGRNEITGPNGVFTVNHTEAWVGDGPSEFALAGQTNTAADYVNDPCDSSVRVFNLKTGEQTDHINIGGCFRTDEGAFDPVDQLAIFANPAEQPLPGNPNASGLNRSPFITLISTDPVKRQHHHKIVKQINYDGRNGTVLANGGIEQPVYVPETGKFYIAVPGDLQHPNDGWISVVDPDRHGKKDIKVVENIPTPGCNPHGLALGPDAELFLGCNSGPERVMDARTGDILQIVTETLGGCDEVYFNAGDNHFVGACATSTAGVFGMDQIDAQPIRYDQTIPTAPGAHSIAADRVSVTDWVPAFGGVCGASTACVAIFGGDTEDEED
jgi:hypothetical protein